MDPHKETLRVLLVESSEDGYRHVRSLLDEAPRSRFYLDWARNLEVAFREFDLRRHDAYLVNDHLEESDGLNVLQKAIGRGCQAPFVLLTGEPDEDTDIAAVRAGASDYLIKSEITPHALERAIRYAIERKRVEATLRDSQVQLRHLSAELLHFQEEERKFIAGELHGNLGQLLVAVKLGVENTLAHLKKSRYSSQRLEPLVPVLQHAIEEVRQLYTRLRPIILDDLGVIAALQEYWREFTELHPEVALSASIQVEEEQIPQQLKVIIYRLVQDALDFSPNCGTRRSIDISLKTEASTLCLLIREGTYGGSLASHLTPCTFRFPSSVTAMKERALLSNGRFAEEWDEASSVRTIRVTWSLM